MKRLVRTRPSRYSDSNKKVAPPTSLYPSGINPFSDSDSDEDSYPKDKNPFDDDVPNISSPCDKIPPQTKGSPSLKDEKNPFFDNSQSGNAVWSNPHSSTTIISPSLPRSVHSENIALPSKKATPSSKKETVLALTKNTKLPPKSAQSSTKNVLPPSKSAQSLTKNVLPASKSAQSLMKNVLPTSKSAQSLTKNVPPPSENAVTSTGEPLPSSISSLSSNLPPPFESAIHSSINNSSQFIAPPTSTANSSSKCTNSTPNNLPHTKPKSSKLTTLPSKSQILTSQNFSEKASRSFSNITSDVNVPSKTIPTPSMPISSRINDSTSRPLPSETICSSPFLVVEDFYEVGRLQEKPPGIAVQSLGEAMSPTSERNKKKLNPSRPSIGGISASYRNTVYNQAHRDLQRELAESENEAHRGIEEICEFDEAKIYLVEQDGDPKQLLLAFQESRLLVRHPFTSRKIEQLPLRSLKCISAMELQTEDGRLKHRVKIGLHPSAGSSERERVYYFEDIREKEDFVAQVNLHCPPASTKAREENLQCLKCNFRFNADQVPKKVLVFRGFTGEEDQCPQCNSNLVIHQSDSPASDRTPEPPHASQTPESRVARRNSKPPPPSGNVPRSLLWEQIKEQPLETSEWFLKSLDAGSKLFLEYKLFSLKENFNAAIKCEVANPKEFYEGWAVFSDSKLYLFKSGSVAAETLHSSHKLKSFTTLRYLPMDQGFTLFSPKLSYSFILGDSQSTRELVCYLLGLWQTSGTFLHTFQPMTISGVLSSAQNWINSTPIPRSPSHKADPSTLLAYLHLDWDMVRFSGQVIRWSSVAFVATPSHHFVSLFIGEQLFPRPLATRCFLDLASMHLFTPGPPVAAFHFWEEENEVWLVQTRSRRALQELLAGLEPHWRQTFDVRLPLSPASNCPLCSSLSLPGVTR